MHIAHYPVQCHNAGLHQDMMPHYNMGKGKSCLMSRFSRRLICSLTWYQHASQYVFWLTACDQIYRWLIMQMSEQCMGNAAASRPHITTPRLLLLSLGLPYGAARLIRDLTDSGGLLALLLKRQEGGFSRSGSVCREGISSARFVWSTRRASD